jgi:hypothetical protein
MRRVISVQVTDGIRERRVLPIGEGGDLRLSKRRSAPPESPIETSRSDSLAETKEAAPHAMRTRSHHPESNRQATRMEYRCRSESYLDRTMYTEEDYPDDEVAEDGGDAREEAKEEASLGEPSSAFFARYSVSVGSAIARQKEVARTAVPLAGRMEETKEDPALSKHMTNHLAGEYYMEDPPKLRRRHVDTPLILPCKSLSDSLTTESSLEEYIQLEECIKKKKSSKHRRIRDAIQEKNCKDGDDRSFDRTEEGSVRCYMFVRFTQLFLVFLKCPASFTLKKDHPEGFDLWEEVSDVFADCTYLFRCACRDLFESPCEKEASACN